MIEGQVTGCELGIARPLGPVAENNAEGDRAIGVEYSVDIGPVCVRGS